MSKKQKSSENTVSSKKVKLLECILHVSAIDHGKFTSFRDIKVAEKLSSLQMICDKRLAQPLDSSHHMEDVCSLILETLEVTDFEAIGYHR